MAKQRYSYFGYQVTLMENIGICMGPLETKSQSTHWLSRVFLYFEMMTLFVCTLGLLGATLFSSDLKQISSTMDILTLTASALYKITFMSVYSDHVRSLVQRMDCKFKPFVYKEGEERFSVEYESRRCALYSNIFILSGALTMVFYSLLPVLEGKKFEQTVCNNGTVVLRKIRTYPLEFWIPFESDSNLVYGCIYFVQCCGLIFSAVVYLVNDSFFFMVIYQINLQMRALSLVLVNIGRESLDFEDDNGFTDSGQVISNKSKYSV